MEMRGPVFCSYAAPELCNVVQLKRWLTCRGASTTGRKVELVSRLVEVSMASYCVFIDKSRTIIVVNAARSIVAFDEGERFLIGFFGLSIGRAV